MPEGRHLDDGRRTPWRALLLGVDPGLVRLESAVVAVVAVLVAVAATLATRALLDPGLRVTVVLYAAVLAMFGNIAVTETSLARRRVTTAAMTLPAVAATIVGSLVAPHRVVADLMFVLVAIVAVWVRRFGPRADALGMGMFVPFYSTQFFGATPALVPWLVLAAVVGLTSTLLVRGFVLPGSPRRTLRRVVRAFEGRACTLLLAIDAVVDAASGSDGALRGRSLASLRRRRDRLHTTALQVENELDRLADDGGDPVGAAAWSRRIFDQELALERLTIAVRHLVVPRGARGAGQVPGVPPTGQADPAVVSVVRAGLSRLVLSVDPSRPLTDPATTVSGGRDAVSRIIADPTVDGEWRQVARAVANAAGVLGAGARGMAPEDDASPEERRAPDQPEDGGAHDRSGRDATQEGPTSSGSTPARSLLITTRGAVQVGVAAIAAMVIAETLAPQRWYWAVLTTFVIFTGTQSRGEVLTRGGLRLVGTLGGVLVGAFVASLVGGSTTWSMILMFGCLFLALYLAQVSPALLAFWITIVLALMYGLLGRFSLDVLQLRLVETLIGAGCGALAAFLVLPKRTSEAVADSVDEVVRAMDSVLTSVVARTTAPGVDPGLTDRARTMHAALATLRQRVEVKDGPVPRQRSVLPPLLRALTVVDHYLRATARLVEHIDPADLAGLVPAVERTRANLTQLAALCRRGRRGAHRGTDQDTDPRAWEVHPAAPLLEGALDRTGESDARLRVVTELLVRVDEAVVMASTQLGATTSQASAGSSAGSSSGSSSVAHTA